MNQHRKGLSLFQLIDRNKFDALAEKHDIDRSVRSFKTWEFTQALICSFVMRLQSFREVESALGIPDSTFGDALRLRHSEFFRELCDMVLLEIRAKSENRTCRKGDSPVSLNLRLSSRKMYVFDRAYNDFNFWRKVVAAKSDFVTRLKDCASYRKLRKSIMLGNQNATGVIYDGPIPASLIQ